MREVRYKSVRGVVTALVILCCWAVLLVVQLSGIAGPALSLLLLPVQVFLYTGLFITAHDAMHGSVAPGWRRVNDVIGRLALALYAAFDWGALRSAHYRHHRSPGIAGEDPDFHDGAHGSFLRWYFHFMMEYVSVWQLVRMAIIFNVLHHVAQVPVSVLMLFWVLPALLSTLQLFYFGTYIPHTDMPQAPDNAHHARTSEYPVWLSLLTCYHFGYHLEHHRWPAAAWWELPRLRHHKATN